MHIFLKVVALKLLLKENFMEINVIKSVVSTDLNLSENIIRNDIEKV